MMVFPAIKTTVQRDPKIFSRKTWREILKIAWGKTMEFWHRFILKKHFTHRGAREYNYDERNDGTVNKGGFRKSYTGKKLKKYGHTNPLQLSGALKRQAMVVMDARPKGSGGDLALHVPPYIYYRPYPTSPFMAKELSEISKRDVDMLTRILDSSITKETKNIKRRI